MSGTGGIARTAAAVAVACCVLVSARALAHCDTTNGPVIPEAKAALEKGDATPVLKWVRQEDEAEIEAALAQAVAVRSKGPEAKALADRYFIETVVRVHRAGEGAPYTGVTEEPVAPVVALADRALAEGSADDVIAALGGQLAAAIREQYERVQAAAKAKDKSVEAGRAFVRAYVTYTHYVEGLHAALASAGAHPHELPAERTRPATAGHDH